MKEVFYTNLKFTGQVGWWSEPCLRGFNIAPPPQKKVKKKKKKVKITKIMAGGWNAFKME